MFNQLAFEKINMEHHGKVPRCLDYTYDKVKDQNMESKTLYSQNFTNPNGEPIIKVKAKPRYYYLEKINSNYFIK